MPTETPDVLERLRSVNLAAGEDPAPPWEQTRQRIARPPAPRRPRRRLAAGAAVAALAVAASLVISADGTRPDGASPLGVFEAAAAAAAHPGSARFSGYTAETRVEMQAPGSPAFVETMWKVVRRVSDTEFEARLEFVRPVPKAPRARPSGAISPVTLPDGVERFSRREGDRIRDVTRWRQPYGTVFQGVPAFFGSGDVESPVAVPTDPAEAAAAVAAWAAGRVPDGAHPELARLIREAGRSPIAEALLYAENVLTAPRVSPAVRAAVYRALSRVAQVRVDATATDALGRPAAALIAEDDRGPTNTRSELLIDPETSRVLGERHVFTVDPGANERRPADEPPYGEGTQATTYRYDG